VDQESILRLIRSRPPRCLRRFKAEFLPPQEEWKDDLITEWKLVCLCGSSEGASLGHPLGELKPGFEEVPLFVSPLAFQCARCGVATEFLDTDADGTGAELAKLNGSDLGCAAYRGEGPQQPFPCPRCGTSRGEVVVTLSYNETYMYDLEEDGIEFPFEDLFSWVGAHSCCSVCGELAQVTEIDTKY
jgi:hypothetical protein